MILKSFVCDWLKCLYSVLDCFIFLVFSSCLSSGMYDLYDVLVVVYDFSVGMFL